MKLSVRGWSVVALAAAAMLGACTDLGVGRRCVDPLDAGVTSGAVQLVSPALECNSRLCFIRDRSDEGQPTRALCTATCDRQEDCNRGTTGEASDGLCPSGFACAVATLTGPYSCQSVCICRDDLEPGFNQNPNSGAVVTPSACVSSR